MQDGFMQELCAALGCPPRENAALLNPQVLAYVGDTIFDLAVRTYLINTHDAKAHALHVMSARRVRAAAQAAAAQSLEEFWQAEELAVFKRGRNTRPGSVPKNANLEDYCAATGFEAVLGYLFLSGQQGRLLQVLSEALHSQPEDQLQEPRPYKG
jgi:ribonuclease-3 family protein